MYLEEVQRVPAIKYPSEWRTQTDGYVQAVELSVDEVLIHTSSTISVLLSRTRRILRRVYRPHAGRSIALSWIVIVPAVVSQHFPTCTSRVKLQKGPGACASLLYYERLLS